MNFDLLTKYPYKYILDTVQAPYLYGNEPLLREYEKEKDMVLAQYIDYVFGAGINITALKKELEPIIELLEQDRIDLCIMRVTMLINRFFSEFERNNGNNDNTTSRSAFYEWKVAAQHALSMHIHDNITILEAIHINNLLKELHNK